MTDAVFVSPHLDDAVLSCAGGIQRLVAAGKQVAVVTVFTGDLPVGSKLSTLAKRAHSAWKAGDTPFSERRVEDEAALAVLGARLSHLGMLDAVYRRRRSGRPVYTRMLTGPDPEDVEDFLPQLEHVLARALEDAPDATLFCPAGIGNHPDHVLVRRATEAARGDRRIVYFAEYPYDVAAGSATLAQTVAGIEEYRLAPTEDELATRIEAVACYSSQLRGIFPSTAERIAEIVSARVPVIGRFALGAPDLARSRWRMEAAMRRDTGNAGGEVYGWAAGEPSPFEPS